MEKSKHQDLIDYELLTAPAGEKGELKRVAAFGWFAGGQSRGVGGFWSIRDRTYS
jgi:alpha-aminoadipic semialdehyde synthase